MKTPAFHPFLLVLGLAALIATPSRSFAQEDKGGVESTQGVEKGQVEATVEKISQKDGKAKDRRSKVTPERRKLVRDLIAETGRYRVNKARLEQVRGVAERNGNAELLAKANEMEPKLEAQHKKAMDALRAKYGAKDVADAVAYLDNRSLAEVKSTRKLSENTKRKGTDHAKELKGKGEQKAKRRRKNKDDSSDS